MAGPGPELSRIPGRKWVPVTRLMLWAPCSCSPERSGPAFPEKSLYTQSFLADLVILTVTAFQRAAGKEYSTASSGAADTWLLPVVGEHTGTSDPILFTAESGSVPCGLLYSSWDRRAGSRLYQVKNFPLSYKINSLKIDHIFSNNSRKIGGIQQKGRKAF